MTNYIDRSIDHLRTLRRSHFFMNAIYLMVSTFAVGACGFVFWVIVAAQYPSATIGLAVTLLSLSGLLAMLSLAGFDVTLVRFLPRSERKNDHINSSIIIVALVSAALALGLALSFPLTSPGLAFVTHNLGYLIGFICVTTVTTLTLLANAIFLAFKRVRDMLVINVVSSLLKIALPLLVAGGDVMTIFVLVGMAQLAGLVVSFVVMRLRLGYRFAPCIHLDILRETRNYSSAVYVSSILNLLPPTLLPLIIIHQLGAESAAYYYMAFTIATMLYTISYASMQSAFAEGSHDEAAMKGHITKAAKLIVVLLVPAIVIVGLFSRFILSIFGAEYATHGTALLQLFAVSALTVALCSALGTSFKVVQNLRAVVTMNGIYAAVILGLSYTLVSWYGIEAIGWAWLIGTITAAGGGLLFLRRSTKTKE